MQVAAALPDLIADAARSRALRSPPGLEHAVIQLTERARTCQGKLVGAMK
jgi:hypothetical protein